MLDIKRGHRSSRWVKNGVLWVLGAGLVFMLAKSLMPKPTLVDAVPAALGPLVVEVDEDGQARVKDRYIVSAPLAGELARVELEPGDEVRRGQVVARIMPLTSPLLDDRARLSAEARVAGAAAAAQKARAHLEQAEADLSWRRSEAARYERLTADEITTARDLEQAHTAERTAHAQLDSAGFAHKVAEHELRMARAALGRLRDPGSSREELEVPAPVSGRVLEVHTKSQGAVGAGTALIELGDPAALEVVVDVLTRDAVRMSTGAEVRLVRWGGPELRGRVRRIEPSAFTRVSALGVEEQRVNVIIDLEEARELWASLGDGFRVEARVTLWKTDKALSIPASAVFRDTHGWATYCLRDDRARLCPVDLGRRTDARVQIISGLEEGDLVIDHPSDHVRDGARVRVRNGDSSQRQSR